VPRLERDGTYVHYQVTSPAGVGSDAPAVLLLHNIFCDHRVFAHAAATLARHYRTIALDFRGHGASELPARPYGIDDLVADCVGVLDAQGVKRASVVGLSLGATIALELALRHPDRVDRLVMMGADVEPDGWLTRVRHALLLGLLRLIGFRRILVGEVAKVLFGKSFRAEAGPALAGWSDRIRGLGARAAGYALRCWKQRPMRTDELAGLRAPLLVVVGDEDVSCPPACGEKIQRAVPGAKLVHIPAAGHTMTAERPEPTTAAITTFLYADGASAR
jgi:pimeloyl-ACP methyl ester carboxylesterase